MSGRFCFVLVFLLSTYTAQAQDDFVPEELADWQEWVLRGHEYRACPFYFNSVANGSDSYVCAWPGELALSVEDMGGNFSQVWTVYGNDTWLPLPGDASYWPSRVTVDGRSVEVVEHHGRPSVRLATGRYRLRGSFEWDERPGILQVPYETGLVSLTVNGKAIEQAQRNGDRLFLGERQQESQARDSVSADVYRLVADNIPTRLTTTLNIEVSGGVREELFGPILPDGFVPLSISSQLPTRLEADGNLRVQVRPGFWTVTLVARAEDVRNEISMPSPLTNMPDVEIWSYEADEALRVTAAEGPSPVDPSQVDVPGHWQRLPAFRVQAGGTLTIVERSRGMVATDNQLTLRREMWLDFDAGGFIYDDVIGGTMRTGWRLDMRAPLELLAARENNEDLLITRSESEGVSGVELRQSNVNLLSLARGDVSGPMPVTGWESRFANVSTDLYLPPGHKLLAAPGVDVAAGTWFSQWQLLDFFLVLIITIAAWRLFGRNAGIIALAALVLSFHEINAPAWLWLNMLIAIALLRVAPAGRLRRSVHVYQAASAILLVIAIVPFVASQMRIAIYPQLENQNFTAMEQGLVYPAADRVSANAPAPGRAGEMKREADGLASIAEAETPAVLEDIVIMAQKRAQVYEFSRYADNSVVQAGRGIPSWKWNHYRLNWSGPVDSDQDMRLMILPRWSVTFLRFLEVAMLLLLVTVISAEMFNRRWSLPGGLNIGRPAATALVAFGMGIALLAPAPSAEAQTPSPEILNELQNRLLEVPDCVPRCAEIASAMVTIDGESVNMDLTIHAIESVALPLPGSMRGWRPNAVLLDGSATTEVIRNQDDVLWVRVEPGQHRLTLRGSVPAADSLEIPFSTPPRVIEVVSDGWFVAGVKDRRLLSGSLQLTRLQQTDDGDPTARWESSRFPAFAHVSRTIFMDVDWRVQTTVSRVAPMQGALILEVPLIDGESVLTENIEVGESGALVSMSPTQQSVSWVSALPRTSELMLTATAGSAWSESWSIGVGSIWHAEFSGVPESESGGNSGGARFAQFRPRGGESLTLQASRPEAVEGSTLAFDSVALNVNQGARSATVNLSLLYRSTRGAQHVITLPIDAEVENVQIDGSTQPLRARDGELTVPILPGHHRISVQWRQPGDIGIRSQTPDVDLGAAAGNIALHMTIPGNRWLVATSGPVQGPAVLYWSELAVLILIALVLGRVGLSPLKSWHWLLLGLGFSTFSWPAFAVVAAWLLLCGARERWQHELNWWQFDLRQIGLAVLTVIALSTIIATLPAGLLGTPDMHVTGNNSYGNALNWFADQSDSALPGAAAFSLPIWVYKALILAWALWLSFALLRWLPWVWQCFSKDGFWQSRKRKALQAPEEAP